MNSFLTVTEYITPLREGGSLPAIVRAEDSNLYVLKFHGAGQGPKVLIAEWIAGEIARQLGFNVPELLPLHLDPAIGKAEPDPEIQDLLNASAGVNLGMTYLEGSATFNLLTPPHPSPEFAAKLVWFDAFVCNVDRTPRNVNMLIHNHQIWLIDHGASLHFHYMWSDPQKQSLNPFPLIKDHVLLPVADSIEKADRDLRQIIGRDILEDIIQHIPADWLQDDKLQEQELRSGYVDYLVNRVEHAHIFVEEAERARRA